jgi:hypothetical protein
MSPLYSQLPRNKSFDFLMTQCEFGFHFSVFTTVVVVEAIVLMLVTLLSENLLSILHNTDRQHHG